MSSATVIFRLLGRRSNGGTSTGIQVDGSIPSQSAILPKCTDGSTDEKKELVP